MIVNWANNSHCRVPLAYQLIFQTLCRYNTILIRWIYSFVRTWTVKLRSSSTTPLSPRNHGCSVARHCKQWGMNWCWRQVVGQLCSPWTTLHSHYSKDRPPMSTISISTYFFYHTIRRQTKKLAYFLIYTKSLFADWCGSAFKCCCYCCYAATVAHLKMIYQRASQLLSVDG